MKLRIILSLVVALLIAGNSYANNLFTLSIDDGLVLKGEFTQTSTRSEAPSLPMDADITNDVLFIEFSNAVGEVNVAVSGMSRVIHSSSMNVTTVGQRASISLAGLETGIYLLEFKNSKGGYVYGEFIVD